LDGREVAFLLSGHRWLCIEIPAKLAMTWLWRLVLNIANPCHCWLQQVAAFLENKQACNINRLQHLYGI